MNELHFHDEAYIMSIMQQFCCDRDCAIEILNELDLINIHQECREFMREHIN